MSKQQILLDTARTYVMLARVLQANGINCKHYLFCAKWCMNKYYLLKNDVTIKLAA